MNARPADPVIPTRKSDELPAHYLAWPAVLAGAVVAAAVSSVFLAFGSGIGLAVGSPSATWRDASSLHALLGGLWLLLTSLASFGLGAYLTGALRSPFRTATPHEVEFRDGVHGLLVWATAILIAAVLTFASQPAKVLQSEGISLTASSSESFLTLALDRLLRSDQASREANASDIRPQAARIMAFGVVHGGLAPDDRAYLARAVAERTGVTQPEAQSRVDKAFADANAAVSKARHSAVILAFMISASLMIGAAVAWIAAAEGGKHRDASIWHEFWRRWEVDRRFVIR